jgi:hypothetical protein
MKNYEEYPVESTKEMYLRFAKDAARRAVEYLDMHATGAAKAELLKALAELEKIFKLS